LLWFTNSLLGKVLSHSWVRFNVLIFSFVFDLQESSNRAAAETVMNCLMVILL